MSRLTVLAPEGVTVSPRVHHNGGENGSAASFLQLGGVLTVPDDGGADVSTFQVPDEVNGVMFTLPDGAPRVSWRTS